MTNSVLLREKIAASGYKMQYLAERCGLTYQGFLNKVSGKNDFRQDEMYTLSGLLNLTRDEFDQIFFSQNVDKLST